MGEIQCLVAAGMPDPLLQRLLPALHHDFLHLADQFRIAADLNGPLPLQHDHDAAGLLFFRNVIGQFQCRRIGPL